MTLSRISIHGGMSKSPRGRIPDSVFRSALPQSEFRVPNHTNEKPRRNPKTSDGVFHAFTSRKVAALDSRTPDPRFRSDYFEILRGRDRFRSGYPGALPATIGKCPRHFLTKNQR